MQIATVALEREVTELIATNFLASSRQSISDDYSKLELMLREIAGLNCMAGIVRLNRNEFSAWC